MIFILWQVRGMVCDNHAANVMAYKKLKEDYLDEVVGLSINYQGQRLYSFNDTVHLIKKFEIIFWAIKGSCFLARFFFGFEQDVFMPGGKLSWRLLHDIHDADGR